MRKTHNAPPQPFWTLVGTTVVVALISGSAASTQKAQTVSPGYSDTSGVCYKFSGCDTSTQAACLGVQPTDNIFRIEMCKAGAIHVSELYEGSRIENLAREDCVRRLNGKIFSNVMNVGDINWTDRPNTPRICPGGRPIVYIPAEVTSAREPNLYNEYWSVHCAAVVTCGPILPLPPIPTPPPLQYPPGYPGGSTTMNEKTNAAGNNTNMQPELANPTTADEQAVSSEYTSPVIPQEIIDHAHESLSHIDQLSQAIESLQTQLGKLRESLSVLVQEADTHDAAPSQSASQNLDVPAQETAAQTPPVKRNYWEEFILPFLSGNPPAH